MTNDIQAFIQKFEKKYGEIISITTKEVSMLKGGNTHVLCKLEQITITQMHLTNPELRHITSFKHKTRKIEFMRYTQAFQYVAFTNGFKKGVIAAYVNRTHASVINSIKQVENYKFNKCLKFSELFTNLLNTIDNYVESISNDDERQNNTKSTNVIMQS
jgi:hypothetical protein